MGVIAEQETKRSCSYAFQDEVLVVDDAFVGGDELIADAERLSRWKRATMNAKNLAYKGAERSNDTCVVDHRVHKDWLDWEHRLSQSFHSCVHAYKALNPHLNAREDTFVQVLRYQPGQHYKLHVDNISGHMTWGARQLSAICFLNDDYEGGQLEFPRQKRKIQPKAGRLVLFPANFCFPHEAHSVLRGVKYTAVTWFV
jgi:predicted 2-oxoglutarate/Fe(II)-dependent dioxygenase YbiX